MNNRTEEKLKDTSGMERTIKALLQQAWERGYKYGYARGVENNKEVKVFVDGEQVYPPIETSYDLYREETCDRKAHCYDYKYWHCIGCNGCKADVRGGKQ